MSRNGATFTPQEDHAELREIDLAEMESVSGGCRNCGSNTANGSSNQLAAILPLLAGQNTARGR